MDGYLPPTPCSLSAGAPGTRSFRRRSAPVCRSWPQSARRQASLLLLRVSSTRPWSDSSAATDSTCTRPRSALSDSRIIDFVLSVLAARPALRVAVISAYILLVEWARALISSAPHAAV